VLVFDGSDVYWSDGSDGFEMGVSGFPVLLPTAALSGLLGIDDAGRILKLVNPTAVKMVLRSYLGNIAFEVDTSGSGLQAPTTGSGVLTKIAAEGFLRYLADEGLVYINPTGEAISVPSGANGQVMLMHDGTPTWSTFPSGNIASGANSIGLEGVTGNSMGDNHTITMFAPTFTLSDGVNDIKIANLSIGASLEVAGIGGLDTGFEAINTWYYFYAVSNGAAFGGVISTNPTVPNFGASGYTYWALMSVFRNDSAGNIVQYIQRGRHFTIAPQLVGDLMTVGTSFVPVPAVTPLTTIIPPNVKSCSGICGGSVGAAGDVTTFVASTATKVGMQAIGRSDFTQASVELFAGGVGSFHDLVILDTLAPQIFWRANQGNAKRRMMINSYRI
jgi:hypothetical protein